jgi:hypothetical protein
VVVALGLREEEAELAAQIEAAAAAHYGSAMRSADPRPQISLDCCKAVKAAPSRIVDLLCLDTGGIDASSASSLTTLDENLNEDTRSPFGAYTSDSSWSDLDDSLLELAAQFTAADVGLVGQEQCATQLAAVVSD